jgi:hypothetical protein
MASANISIFAKPASYRRTVRLPFPHLVRGSSIIRGEQIAEYLGCKLNPANGYENDVCIYVKPDSLDKVKDGDWVDIMDGHGLLRLLDERPDVNVIAFSDCTYSWYGQKIVNNMVLIPQHHCNFNRELRVRSKVETVGFIGGEMGFDLSEDRMRSLVEAAGFNFLYVTRYKTRKDVVNFYRQIDIQVTWCKPKLQAKCPLKVVNAASFGIPTVGWPQACYQEVDGKYIKAPSTTALVRELNKLHDEEYYRLWALRVIPVAEKYHIGSVAELYRNLR